MKQWNWKRMIRVVLILLVLGITISSIIRSNIETKCGVNRNPWFELEYYDKAYPLDDATVNLHFGTYEFSDEDRTDQFTNRDFDSMHCVAWYYCSPADFSQHGQTHMVEDYQSWANHHFIKELSFDEAVSYGYGVWEGPFGYTYYQHSEKLTIPREILEEYQGNSGYGTLCIVMVKVYIKDGKQYMYMSSYNSLTLVYKITDDGYVVFL